MFNQIQILNHSRKNLSSSYVQSVAHKKTKKRIFKMAPLHHHFELCGWHETKVVRVFDIITVIMGLIGILSVFIGGM